MRRRVVIAAVAITVLFTGWLIDNGHGAALDVGDGGLSLEAPVGWGDAYFMGPALKNDSRTSIELVKVEPVTISAGMEFVEARFYRRDDFPMGGLPASWSAGDGDIYDPTKVASVPVRGFELPGQHIMSDQVMMLRFRVAGRQRPLTADGLRVTYRNGFRNHTQTLRVSYTALPPLKKTS